MAGLSITGQMKVSTLQAGFLRQFGLTLRVYDGRSFADPTQTLAQVRKKKGSGKALSVAKNMKVGNLEDKFEEEFGLRVQIAGSDDSYLCDNDLTLNGAQQEDEKKLGRKAKKASREKPSSADEDFVPSDLEDYPESTRTHLATIKRLSFNEGKSDDQIAETLNIDEMDVIEALILIEMDMDSDVEGADEDSIKVPNAAEVSSEQKKLTIVGQGGEIVIGCLPSHHVEELMEIGEADIDEDDIENVTGKPWSELDDIWHFYGPFEDFELHDEVGHALECEDSFDWDWDDNAEDIKKFTKKPVKNLWDLEVDERYLLIVVNGEKGSWGQIEVPEDFKIEALQVVSGDSEFDTEYCVSLGFVYDGKFLEWDEDGETRGTFRTIKIFDTEEEEVVLEF